MTYLPILDLKKVLNILNGINTSDNELNLVDIENSNDCYDNNFRGLRKDRKQSAINNNNAINIKDENHLATPIRKDYGRNITNNSKRVESVGRLDTNNMPHIRKKDLNVYLHERGKSRGPPKKLPFK